MDTTKRQSKKDGHQTLKSAYNDVDGTFSMSGFLTGKVGHKITLAISTTSIVDDTETYTYSDDGVDLYSIQVVYTDGTRETMISAERIS